MEAPELAKSSSNQIDTMKISAVVHSDLFEQERARLKRYSQARTHMAKMEQDFKALQKKRKITEVIDELDKELKEKNKEWKLPIKDMNISSVKFDLNDLNNAINSLILKINSSNEEKECMDKKYELLRDRSWIRWEAECLLKQYRDEFKKSPTSATQDKYNKLLIESQAKWQYPMQPITNINELPTIVQNLDTIVQNLEIQIATRHE